MDELQRQQVGAIVIIALLLGPWTVLALTAFYWSVRERYGEWRDRRIDEKIDRFFKEQRASSSIGQEHPTLNRKVPGSSPGRLTRREDPVRQRIVWHLQDRTAVVFFPSDPRPTKFKWYNLPRPRNEKTIPQAGIVTVRDFRPGEPRVQLVWDGSRCEKFLNEVELKKFLIRFVYGINQQLLVPSELLADANLVYETGDWVDEWFCMDKNDEIIECPREIIRPRNRKIRHDHFATSQRARMAFSGRGKTRGPQWRPERTPQVYEIPAQVEIPDEKCFFCFKAGGFYEKEKSAACEKG